MPAQQAEGVPTRPITNLMEARQVASGAACPVAEELARRTIALPYDWKLSQDDVDQMARAHDKVTRRLTRPYFTDLTDAAASRAVDRKELPITRYVASKTIALPYHWKLTQADVDTIVTSHHAAVKECSP